MLERLSGLQHLILRRCRLPDCLPRLTGLRSLRLQGGTLKQPEDAAVCAQALPRLTSLRHLILISLPAAVSVALPRCTLHVLGIVQSKPHDAALPSGPWLKELRELGVPATLLHASLQRLRSAAQLQHVAVVQAASCGDGMTAIVNWAVGPAPLHLLAVSGTEALPPTVWACIVQGQRRRPELHIQPCADAMQIVAACRVKLEGLT